MQICFFEDETCKNFNPLTLTRPTDNLRTGILTISEKWRLTLRNEKWTRCIRPELRKLFTPGTLDDHKTCLWINSRYLPSKQLLDKIGELKEKTAVQAVNEIVLAKVSGEMTMKWLSKGTPDFSSFSTIGSVSAPCVTHLWDLFLVNSDEIAADLERLNNTPSAGGTVSNEAILQSEENIFVREGAEIQPGAILIADAGPIYIGKNAKISAGAIVEGPAAVCEKSVIKPGAKIHGNTTVGPVCKVGGEVSDCVFHSYSNKAHDGYLGSSLVGQWCNLGAGTNNSNLKNNYSNVRIRDWNTGKTIETGQQFLGVIMGDHSKTAIGTRLNTGTVCGVNCNIFSSDFPPKYIPSFSWVGSDEVQPYMLEKAFETMQTMMARRDVELTEDYKQLMRTIHDKRQTADGSQK